MLSETVCQAPFHSPEADDAWYASWRASELARLDATGLSYVDYTGAALAPASLLHSDFARLGRVVLGNPHSEHAASRASTNDLNEARAAILTWLHASDEEYVVILTANASAACRLVGEAFPFEQGSALCLTADNHNSVNGIREFARPRGARTVTLPLNEELRLESDAVDFSARPAPSLFAFPAQSNFSGVRHPLTLVNDAQARGYRVLLDAASFLPTASLNLGEIKPDFVVFSLYKIIGYPWGMGALVARRDALAELSRPWFAGGTVDWVSIAHGRHQLHDGVDAFEDGTPAFLAAGAVTQALKAYQYAQPDRLARQTRALTAHLLQSVRDIRHDNGSSVVRVYGPDTVHDRGSTVAMNIVDRNGIVIPFWNVEQDALKAKIAVRGGCFCNPGCAERAFQFPVSETSRCLDRLGRAFTIPQFAACMDSPAVGAIRVSFGLGSVCKDVHRVIAFLSQYTNREALSLLHTEPAA